MARNYKNITIALAALFQQASLVHTFAQTGTISNEHLSLAVSSILNTTPKHTLDIYGNNAHNLELGFRELMKIFSRKNKVISKQVFSYVLDILAVERSLHRSQKSKQNLRTALDIVKQQAEFFGQDSAEFIDKTATVYIDNISKLPPRIHVLGKAEIISEAKNIAIIRTLLLAGVRAALLWRQNGGKRWQLFFSRKESHQAIKDLLGQ